MAPTAAALVAAWESGAALPPTDRAPALLHALDFTPRSRSVDRLTVGQCDAELFRLRRSLFGSEIDALATCPTCHAEVELLISLDDIQPPCPVAGEAQVQTIETHGYRVASRSPTNADLRRLAELGAGVRARDLLGLCLVEAHDPAGAVVGPNDLPDAAADAILDALASGDPGASVPLGVRCPCGVEWVDELDIRAIVWSDLTDWIGHVLSDVHQLARAYGWSEADILAMSPWRRRWYLEAVGW